MAEPFLGEIRILSFAFPPKGWALCNGQLLPINQNQALFALLGTTYGGDGRITFALPNLQGRVPLHFNGVFPLGSRGGEDTHTLLLPELPSHAHSLVASTNVADQTYPPNHFWAKGASAPGFHPNATSGMDPGTITPTGGSQPHENRPPFLVLNFAVALLGIFPSRD
jgi:microcystin-dependent protein